MRERIGEGDRDERVHEAPRELARPVSLTGRSHSPDAQAIEAPDDEHAAQQAHRPRQLHAPVQTRSEVGED